MLSRGVQGVSGERELKPEDCTKMYKHEEDQQHVDGGSGSLVQAPPESQPPTSPAKRQRLRESNCDADMEKRDPCFLSLWNPHLEALDDNFTSTVNVCALVPPPESQPPTSPAKRRKLRESSCDADMEKRDPCFLSLWNPHLEALDDNFTSTVNVCALVPLPLIYIAGDRGLGAAAVAGERQKVMKFNDGEEMGKLDPSFLSLWSPQSKAVDNNFTIVEASRSRPSQDKLLDVRETALAPKLPSQTMTMNISRDEEGRIAPATPSTREFKCKICPAKFSTFQALGGHTTGHMKSRPAGEHRAGQMTPMRQPATAAGRHECSLCGRCFPSGQALGGHKRLHRDKNVGRRQHEEINGSRLLGSRSMGFDLNQPPPEEP